MLTFLPVVPLLANLLFQIVALRDFGKQYGLPIQVRHYAKLVLGAIPYMLVLSGAAVRAVWRERRGRTNWELTRHVGAHLPAPTPVAVEA
jgi:hypothetical protein